MERNLSKEFGRRTVEEIWRQSTIMPVPPFK